MRTSKRIWATIMIVAMMLSSISASVSAQGRQKHEFKDVNQNHWAYEKIQMMVEYNIINGYADDTFRPELTVSRAEFAKMMVLTLNLEVYNPKTASFADVKKGHWAYPYVETGKYYLTGFKTSGGIFFRPDRVAVREDMAVGIIRGLGINPDKTDMSVLDSYTDKNAIAPNLRKFVAAAINEGIMIGNNNKFAPKAGLTRAEAATLLARLIEEEKVVFDQEEKVTFDQIKEKATRTPTVEVKIVNGQAKISWTQVPSEGFKYYKVVISKNDSSPSYPSNGYQAAISNVTTTSKVIGSGDGYNSGDFGGVIKAGETYYVAITAVYHNEKLTSNVETMTLPGTYEAPDESKRTPTLSYSIKNNGVKLNWTQTPKDGFKYYKVVLSKNNATPKYPDDGYATYISDCYTTSYFVQEGTSYHGNGDFGDKIKSEKYYMTITAVYNNGKYTSATKRVTVPAK